MSYPNPYQNAFAEDIKRFRKLARECDAAATTSGFGWYSGALYRNIADVFKLQQRAAIERKLDRIYFWAARVGHLANALLDAKD